MKAPPFKSRWRILGTLTTLSELHIGDGGSGELKERYLRARKAEKDEHDVQTVCVNHGGQAFIPSTALRGPLRSLVYQEQTQRWSDSRWNRLLGSPKPDAKEAVGGQLIFYDAFWQKGFQGAGDPITHPWWSATRRTCVATSVSLDRRRRTAADKLLYQIEYVPAGETFSIEIGLEKWKNEEEENDETDIAHLLALLETLNAGTTLGALASNGWGQVRWQLTGIERFTAADLAAWKADSQRKAGIAMTRPLPAAEKATLLKEAATLHHRPSKQQLVIELQLQMTSPWIVRDARQRERLQKAKDDKVPEDKRPVGATPMLDEKGRPFIPAKSFRGLLRSQAERILRTLGVEVKSPDKQPVISPRLGVPEALHEVSKLDLATKLFGASGWRAPLEPTRLSMPKEVNAPKLLHQEFVAVDRFTGGAADNLKFNANFAPPCILEGKLTVDLDHITQVESSSAYRGLLALVLRDLAEGDLSPGAHAAIGCGACTCTATITDAGKTYPTLQEWFASQPVKDGLEALRPPGSHHTNVQTHHRP